MSVRPIASIAVLAFALALLACGHGPDFPEYNDGGADGGAGSSSSGAPAPPPGAKPCDFADGSCACFVAQGNRGCCIGAKSKLSSEMSPAGARIFDPSDPNGAIDDVDVSCKDTMCRPSTGVDGVLVLCPTMPTVSCGCS